MAETVNERLRRAGPPDAPAITRLVRECYGGYVERIGREPKPMTADYAHAVQAHEVWVLEEHGALQAVFEIVPADDHFLVENVAVKPSLQRHGIGRRLMAFAEDRAREGGIAELRLFTNEAFVENIVLYQSIGYRETHRGGQQGARTAFMSKRI